MGDLVQLQPHADDGIPPARFREAISRFTTGVTVITTKRPDGPAGMTASAVSSLSLSPLLMLVCISNRLPTHEALLESGCFAVNVLGEGDEDLALKFARPSEDKFADVEVDHSSGLPVLRRAIAHFVCEVREALPGGDHSIFIGEVRHCDFVPHRRPLVYFGSKFGALDSGDTALFDACAWEAAMRM
jgi:flavin reductase (DIM6/NTAB) family NADH-FMN oxidoreductase RutF